MMNAKPWQAVMILACAWFLWRHSEFIERDGVRNPEIHWERQAAFESETSCSNAGTARSKAYAGQTAKGTKAEWTPGVVRRTDADGAVAVVTWQCWPDSVDPRK